MTTEDVQKFVSAWAGDYFLSAVVIDPVPGQPLIIGVRLNHDLDILANCEKRGISFIETSFVIRYELLSWEDEKAKSHIKILCHAALISMIKKYRDELHRACGHPPDVWETPGVQP